MWAEKPSSTPEQPINNPTPAPEVRMPEDHPQKKETLTVFADMLRNLSDMLPKFGGGIFSGILGENGDKPYKFQEFFSKMIGIFRWIDIEKWVTIQNESDVAKIREAFRPIIDIDETSLEFKKWDFIIYNKDTGTVDFFPADSTQKSGHALSPTGIVPVAPSKKPLPKPEDIEKEINQQDQISSNANSKQNKKQPIENNDNISTSKTARALGEYVKRRYQANTWQNSCGTAVDVLLTDFGIKNVTPWYNRHGKNWKGFLEKDPRFIKLEVNSLSDIPPGAVLTFSGKWKINGKPNGSEANQRFGHVEIKWTDGLVHHFIASDAPGGSASERHLHKNFPKWVEATGFTGAYIPIAKTKAEAQKIIAQQKNQNSHAS